jgi:hypothetical protein
MATDKTLHLAVDVAADCLDLSAQVALEWVLDNSLDCPADR